MEIEYQQQNAVTSEQIVPNARSITERGVSETPNNFSSPIWILRSVALPFLLVVISLVLASYLLRHRPSAAAFLNPSLQRAQLESTTFTGVIKPSREIKTASPMSATVLTLFVKVGDRVEEGQTLLALDDRETQAALTRAVLEQQAARQQVVQFSHNIKTLDQSRSIAAARTELAEASGRVSVAQRRVEQVPLRQWRDSPQRAEAAYEQALARYRRADGLHQDGVISEQEFEDAQTALRTTENDLHNARKSIAATESLEQAQQDQARLQTDVASKEQQQHLVELKGLLQQAQLRYTQATAMVETARRALAETSVKASDSGVVVELPAKVGDQMTAGATLARIAKFDHLVVEVPVAASLINTLRRGQSALVTLPTVDQQQIEGTVITISPLPASNLNHTVEVELENRTGALLVNQTAEVRFSQS